MQAFIDWLTALPPIALYSILLLVAGLENIFPPVPADTVVALGAFLAARGDGNVVIAFLSTWFGNIVGAMAMYVVGRRYGAERLQKRFLGDRGPAAEHRLERLYGRYGIVALFSSRFIPGVRALVPPFAGAFHVPPVRAAIAMGGASLVWYGTVSYLGYSVGGNWPQLLALISRYGRNLAIVAGALLLVGIVVWRIRSKRPDHAS